MAESTSDYDALPRNLLEQHYNVQIADMQTLYALDRDAQRILARMQTGDGQRWMVRCYAAGTPIPDMQAASGTTTVAAWLASRAATLRILERHCYPAPRVLPDVSGALMLEADGRCVLVTTFVDGETCEPVPASLEAIGAALGQLHSLELSDDDRARAGRSWWHLELALPDALQRYARITPLVPPEWRRVAQGFVGALHAIAAHPELPHGIIHGDGWAGNAVIGDDGYATLIDWEPSGKGLYVLDLGRLLLHGHQPLADPLARLIVPEQWRVDAIMRGYARHRYLLPVERAMLCDAMRFGIAYGATMHFERALRNGWPEAAPGPLLRRRAWFDVCPDIAGMAVRAG
jgi:Ser/Thr protein kinase RdoA (MazF antagonist)